MGVRFLVAFLLALAAAPVCAQPRADAAEIAFWESVRDSKNPAELRAYLQQYPNGVFRPLAEARLATLGQKPAQAPAVGDLWTYRLSYPRLRGAWGQAERPAVIHTVRVGAVSGSEITELLAIDGGTPSDFKHGKGWYLAAEGVSVLSPYLAVFEANASGGRVGSVKVRDPACSQSYRCEARARNAGREIVEVPAGRFEAFKIVVEQQWSPFSVVSTLGSAGADMTGGRTLTAWYSPQIKRVIKYSSRLVAGAIPPMDATFDLELVSYELK
jgi:hypothetical protein